MDIKYEYETEFLGLRLTEGIKLNIHIKNVRSKLDRSYYIMQSLQGITGVNILRSIYFCKLSFVFVFFPARWWGK
jgi:hypothetical protein